ncbi:ROK family protein [Terracoccus luteus]|uniref:ROK family protein n=1 Tax=Terracoccus luteus TaxID=53356 RepID=UPI00288969E4|nr:ROK family protein [Terracoccus luteus]
MDVKLSDGLGASLVLNGSPYGGASGLAGEIGHTQVSGDAGPWCRCGNRGCHETLVSASFVHDLLRDHPMSVQDGAFPLRDAADHPAIARFVTEAGRTLGRALADVCNRLNPSGIVLGGQLGTADAPLVDGVREAIQRYSQPSTAEGVHVKEHHARASLRAHGGGGGRHPRGGLPRRRGWRRRARARPEPSGRPGLTDVGSAPRRRRAPEDRVMPPT